MSVYVLEKFAKKEAIKNFVWKNLSDVSNESKYNDIYEEKTNITNFFPNVPEITSVPFERYCNDPSKPYSIWKKTEPMCSIRS